MKIQRNNCIRFLNIFLSSCFIFIFQARFGPFILASNNSENQDKCLKIGLLIHDKNSLAARHGAEMAIQKANEKGGLNGRPFQLVVRSMEGPWGTGSKEAVNLIFEEEVLAILGSHDGRNAHLVEQVTAKARLVFLSAWATDPTLSQAFIPWYFSCVPNDNQQAEALIEEIYNKRKISGIAVISGNDYDSKSAFNSFIKKAKQAGKKDPLQLFYDNSTRDFNELLDQINKAEINAIILFGQPLPSLKLVQQIHLRNMDQLVFGSFSVLNENDLSFKELKDFENVVLTSSGFWSGSGGSNFRQDYQRAYGNLPGTVAALAFDGMNLIIEAVKNAGPDRNRIQKSLSTISFEGVTGTIHFDDKGNRMGTPGLMEIINGVPVNIVR
jgi:branched-chain amino acid transport system substrate-binding protein